MSETSPKPVIFLAFAQDRVEGGAYLRNLPIELDGIRKALQKARQAGLCEIVERSNTTVENVLDVFQEYQDRIAIFHYGGHAGSYALLLESLIGEHVIAHSEGLVSFLAKQKGLQLIFLNGCSSQQQALDLIETGFPAVIGTSQKINDEVATALSVRFYKGLAAGASIDRAWAEAVDEVKTAKGTANLRDLFGEETEGAEDRFPWEIYYCKGAEIVKEWNLPEAVANPLFGLPEIPKTYDLPETLFLFLKRYERAHAEIFFGRSYYIRALYNRISDPKSDPIILLYGQSGVGKSSLFDAGLNPRLEKDYAVIYVRRIQEKGLAGTMAFALEQQLAEVGETQMTPLHATPAAETTADVTAREEALRRLEAFAQETDIKIVRQEIEALVKRLQNLQLDSDARTDLPALQAVSNSEDLRLKALLQTEWKQIEARIGKPLIVILDQVEELYTRPNAAMPEELNDFMAALQSIFGSPANRPLGKLILGYRKEYHPEIEEAFKTFLLPRATVFLEHLSRKDILDIFRGLTRTPVLKSRYNLSVEDELPVIIADDLLEDKDSPVAPVLQIVLTKLWNAAYKENPTAPRFTVAQYQQLRKEGIAMAEFFEQQMEKLKAWQSEVVDSGLALDVLHFHTTALGTAGHCTLEKLRETYQHRQEIIDALVAKCKELYLLTEASQSKEASSLTHDTLAPIVISEYHISGKPGQRAARILSNKMRDFQENEVWLDEADLALVEKGKIGMRRLVVDEEKLLEISRERKAQRDRNRKRIWAGAVVMAALIVISAVFAVFKAREANQETRKAQRQLVLNYWENSRTARDQNQNLLALHLAAYAVGVSPDNALNSHILLDIDKPLQMLTLKQIFQHNGAIRDAKFSRDGKRLLTWSEDSTARLWQAETGMQIGQSMKHDREVLGAMFDQAEQRILTWSNDGTARLWDIGLDLDFPAKDYEIELQALTGTSFNVLTKAIEAIDDPLRWRQIREEYLQLARKHYQDCQYPRANRFRQLFPEDAAKIRKLNE